MASTSDRPKTALKRDGQLWQYDHMVQETGKVFHFQTDGRGGLPKSVRRHAMISKHLGLVGRRMWRLAEEELEAGHRTTALERYFAAAEIFANAQHIIFENNEEKKYLHGASLSCFEKVRELAPYRIEHVDVEWNGTVVSGNLHLAPVEEPAPCVFFIPGCDMTKEMYPHPLYNQALQRGMHMFVFDGPGQGESNLRGIKLTPTNYEEATGAVIDHLLTRPEIDPAKIGVYGLSFGSYWAFRIAAHDSRVAAVAAPWASYADLSHLMNEESPRYKQLFMYLTGSSSEADLDQLTASMSVRGMAPSITCPMLLAVGEYDVRSPLEEVYELFDDLACPKELWVFGDQHHKASLIAPNSESLIWLQDMHALCCDWLQDRFTGKPLANDGEVVYLEPGGSGPYGKATSRRRRWFESRP